MTQPIPPEYQQHHQQSTSEHIAHTGNGVPLSLRALVQHRILERTRKRQKEQKSMEEISNGCMYFILRIGFLFLAGWMFMLGVGVVHNSWTPMMPTIAFWPAMLLTSIAFVIINCLRPMRNPGK